MYPLSLSSLPLGRFLWASTRTEHSSAPSSNPSPVYPLLIWREGRDSSLHSRLLNSRPERPLVSSGCSFHAQVQMELQSVQQFTGMHCSFCKKIPRSTMDPVKEWDAFAIHIVHRLFPSDSWKLLLEWGEKGMNQHPPTHIRVCCINGRE